MSRRVNVAIDETEAYPVYTIEPLKGRKTGAWENVVAVDAEMLKRWQAVLAAANDLNVELGEIHNRLETERRNRELEKRRATYRVDLSGAVMLKGKATIGLLLADGTVYREQTVPNDSKTVTWFAVPCGTEIVGYQSRMQTPRAILKSFPDYKKELVVSVRLPETTVGNGGDITLQFERGIHLLT